MGSFALDVRKFAEKAGNNADLVVRKVTLDIASRLIDKSPVRTGRFRANWQFGQGAADLAVTDETDPGGQVTKARLQAEIETTGAGGVSVLSNNLPYADRLENGWSKQAPSGMVGVTVVEFQDSVNQAVSELEK